MNFKIIDESNDKKYFTIIPNYIINHSSIYEQGLYLFMKRVAGENGFYYMTEETTCKQLQIGIKKYRKSLEYLLNHKWIEFVGMTAGKTRPVKTYKVNDIWKLNTNYYINKKIPLKRAISTITQKDTAQKSNKIPLKSNPIRITNNKEDINTKREANASGFKSIGSLLKNRPPELHSKTTTFSGANYGWQDCAVRWWKKLSLGGKPSSSWFKLFRDDRKTIERACSYASDSNAKDREKFVYWSYNQFKKYGKIVYKHA